MTYTIKYVIRTFPEQYILSNIDHSVIRILVITLLWYKSAFVPLYFRNVVSAYNNIAETRARLESLFIRHREICFIHGHIYGRFIHFDRAHKSRKNTLIRAILLQNTNYSLQLDKPYETAAMKQYRKSEIVILPLAVSLKKIYSCVCRAL